MTDASLDTRAVLLRRGLPLEYATLGWNVVGTVIVMLAALLRRLHTAPRPSDSTSGSRSSASVVVVWQLKGCSAHRPRERLAMRLIGSAFFASRSYIFVQAA